MIRLFLFLLGVLILGFLFSWVADRPGEVTLQWRGVEYQTSLMVALAALVSLVAFLLVAWWIALTVLRSPLMVKRFFANRRRDRGYNALSGGLIAAGSGDVRSARRLAAESRKLLGTEPLVELLEAQTSLLEGNREAAREQFRGMLEGTETRLIALRGLHLEATRENEPEAARQYAQEAVKILPGLPWASNALLRYQAADGDWEAALRTLEMIRATGRLDKQEISRKRAVLLAAQAQAEEPKAPERAARLAREALALAPALVPAAVTGANALIRLGDIKRAARMLESAWRKAPHPEIADTYVHLRTGDSIIDRLKRARKLANMQRDHVEAKLALAQAAIAAKSWSSAREAMKAALEKSPTERACLIMAELEEGEYGDKGRMRDWLSRAVRAPRDPAWTADGVVSEHWQPTSPVTGELDAFEWKVPVEQLDLPVAPSASRGEIAALSEPLDEQEIEEVANPLPVGSREVLDAAVDAEAARAAEQAMAEPVPIAPAGPAGKAELTGQNTGAEEPAGSDRPDYNEPDGGDKGQGNEKADSFAGLPDDPGVDPDETDDAKKKRFGLF